MRIRCAVEVGSIQDLGVLARSESWNQQNFKKVCTMACITAVLWVGVAGHGSLVIPPARNNYGQKDPANVTGDPHYTQVSPLHPISLVGLSRCLVLGEIGPEERGCSLGSQRASHLILASWTPPFPDIMAHSLGSLSSLL